MTKTPKPKCLKGDNHSVDTWKFAEVIIRDKMLIANMNKALRCAIDDLKKINKNE